MCFHICHGAKGGRSICGGRIVCFRYERNFSDSFHDAYDTVKTDHHLFLEGALGVRVLNAHVASLSLELPVAGMTSQKLTLASTPGTVVDNLSTLFITPGFRLKLLPISPISPWVSVGGGWARYSLEFRRHDQNKGAIQYGGGLDFKTNLPVLGFRAEVRDFVTGDPNFGLASILPGTTAACTITIFWSAAELCCGSEETVSAQQSAIMYLDS